MVVLDASAVLALLQNEPGAERVAAVLDGAQISRVNLAEVLQKLSQRGFQPEELLPALQELGLGFQSLEDADLIQMARWYPRTRSFGLSLGDLACLALAHRLAAPAWTADRIWAQLPLIPEVTIEVIR